MSNSPQREARVSFELSRFMNIQTMDASERFLWDSVSYIIDGQPVSSREASEKRGVDLAAICNDATLFDQPLKPYSPDNATPFHQALRPYSPEEVLTGITGAARALQMALTLHLKRYEPGSMIKSTPEKAKTRLDRALQDFKQDRFLMVSTAPLDEALLVSIWLPISAYTDWLQRVVRVTSTTRTESGRIVFPFSPYAESKHGVTCELVSPEIAKRVLKRCDNKQMPIEWEHADGLLRVDLWIEELPANVEVKPPDSFVFDEALSSLFFIHLADVRTVIDPESMGGGKTFLTGISGLWYDVLEAHENGYLAKCEACGKLLMTKHKSGRRQRYCSKACDMWKRRHPGETRKPRES